MTEGDTADEDDGFHAFAQDGDKWESEEHPASGAAFPVAWSIIMMLAFVNDVMRLIETNLELWKMRAAA